MFEFFNNSLIPETTILSIDLDTYLLSNDLS